MTDAPLHLLDNIVWHSQTGPQAAVSVGNERIRRYLRGFSQLIGAADAAHPDLDALNALCTPDEHFYVLGWSGEAPPGWQVDVDSFVDQFVWHHAAPEAMDHSDIVQLDASHVQRMIALTDLTRPGPFAERTIEFGEFYGVLDGDRLLAMAGERMHAGTLREISGVCTHPDAQGRGHSKRLMNLLLRLQMSRGQVPFLHMMHDNVTARGVYERLGFRHHQRLPCRVVSRIAVS